ncbi:SURF1 family protein [Cupriavidus sp. 30B13]|uniref:SURF1 family protein n=1 Tax=Cupriavidus sp. 30B13 TaxID=3384241 RepID=UPI003B904BD3
MKPWRALSPVPTLAALAVIAVTCALGHWQLDRAHEKIARAQRLQALAAQPPLEIGPALAAGPVAERRVHVRGRFDPGHTVLLDNRPHGNGTDSRAGFLVLTPLRVAGGGPAAPAVLVLRGWLPRDAQDRTRIAPFSTPGGEVDLEGTALETVPRVFGLGRGAQAEAGQKIRQNVDIAAFARELGVTLQPFVLEQRSDSGDGLARDWAPVDIGADRHYGYAFQWFGLAALTLVLLVALAWRRARRMAAGAQPEMQPEPRRGRAVR